MVKKKTKTQSNLEHLLSATGIGVIILAGIATLFSMWNNQRFIHEPLDIVYYCRYLLLLGGGFLLGAMVLRTKPAKNAEPTFFLAATYAILAVSVFFFLDILRLLFRDFFGEPSYPWGKIIFLCGPLIALLIVAGIAFVLRKWAYGSALRLTKILFISLFAIQQIQIVWPVLSSMDTTVWSAESVWILLLGFIAFPLTVAVIAYLLFGKVKSQLDRVFYSALIGTMYFIATLLAWEFRTNAEAEATAIFGTVVTGLIGAVTILVLWRSRKAIQ